MCICETDFFLATLLKLTTDNFSTIYIYMNYIYIYIIIYSINVICIYIENKFIFKLFYELMIL